MYLKTEVVSEDSIDDTSLHLEDIFLADVTIYINPAGCFQSSSLFLYLHNFRVTLGFSELQFLFNAAGLKCAAM